MNIDTPLTDAEVDDLESFLRNASEDAESMFLVEAEGYMTAVISGPAHVPPSTWLPMIWGTRSFENDKQAKHYTGLLLRHYNDIVTNLMNEATLDFTELHEDDACLWCAGYLRAASMDEAWRSDQKAGELLVPLAIVSGDINLVGEKDEEGNTISDPTPFIREATEEASAAVLAVYQHFLAKRSVPVVAKPKVGRNEPCPCGSGKKFKQCCIDKVS